MYRLLKNYVEGIINYMLKGTTKQKIDELVSTKPSPKRDKAIKTYMKNHNLSYNEAKRKLAVIIALNS